MIDKFVQKTFDERNWIEKITEFIPLYSGYQNKDRRREADKILRMSIVGNLNKGIDILKGIQLDLTEARLLNVISKVERLISQIEYLRDKIKTASYGYSGFFDNIKIKETELDLLYQHDYNIISKVNDLNNTIEPFSVSETKHSSEISNHINQWCKKIETIQQLVIDRESVILKSKGL